MGALHPATLVRDELGRKLCRVCEQWKTESEFYSNVRSADRFDPLCKQCKAFAKRAIRYNLTVDQIIELLEERQYRCDICSEDVIVNFVIDHDHACCPESSQSCGTCVRGILCQRCNRTLGSFADTPNLLHRAADYLERPRG